MEKLNGTKLSNVNQIIGTLWSVAPPNRNIFAERVCRRRMITGRSQQENAKNTVVFQLHLFMPSNPTNRFGHSDMLEERRAQTRLQSFAHKNGTPCRTANCASAASIRARTRSAQCNCRCAQFPPRRWKHPGAPARSGTLPTRVGHDWYESSSAAGISTWSGSAQLCPEWSLEGRGRMENG